MRCFCIFWTVPRSHSDTPHLFSRRIPVYIARYDGIAPTGHLDVLYQDGLAAPYAYAVNRQQCFLTDLHHASRRIRNPRYLDDGQRFIQSHAELLHCHAMTGCHLVANHLFERACSLSRLRRIDGRFGDARPDACGKFYPMFAGDYPDHVRFVFEPIYQEVEPKLWTDGFAGSWRSGVLRRGGSNGAQKASARR
jgi:hypothetical protein